MARKSDRVARYEFHCAFLSHKGIVHIFNGRNGTVRRMEAVDQQYTDWEPFAPSDLTPRRRIKELKVKG